MIDRAAALAGLVLALVAGLGGVIAWSTFDPPLDRLPRGPVLERAVQRGTLIVGVRSYARPSPPEAPTPPEPDRFDAALAARLAATLGVKVALVGLAQNEQRRALDEGRIDVLLAGVPAVEGAKAGAASDGIAFATGSVDPADGLLVALRKGPLQDLPAREASALRGVSVCVGEGSVFASTVEQRYGARARSYPSSVHAVSAFMAGECAALAEDTQVLQRLMTDEAWRFYKPIAMALQPGADAAIGLAEGDAVSRDYLAAAVRRWHADGTLTQLRTTRAGNLQFEISQLGDGLICHS